MDRNERPSQPSGEDSGASENTSRRKFLRQFGVTAAAAAGVAGLAGMKPAAAAVKGRTASLPYLGIAPQKIVRSVRTGQQVTPDCIPISASCSCSPGHCGTTGGTPCPPGYWCNRCWGTGAHTCFGTSGYFCVKGGCSHFPHRAGVCTLC
jgi:hypothetical protein